MASRRARERIIPPNISPLSTRVSYTRVRALGVYLAATHPEERIYALTVSHYANPDLGANLFRPRRRSGRGATIAPSVWCSRTERWGEGRAESHRQKERSLLSGTRRREETKGWQVPGMLWECSHRREEITCNHCKRAFSSLGGGIHLPPAIGLIRSRDNRARSRRCPLSSERDSFGVSSRSLWLSAMSFGKLEEYRWEKLELSCNANLFIPPRWHNYPLHEKNELKKSYL